MEEIIFYKKQLAIEQQKLRAFDNLKNPLRRADKWDIFLYLLKGRAVSRLEMRIKALKTLIKHQQRPD